MNELHTTNDDVVDGCRSHVVIMHHRPHRWCLPYGRGLRATEIGSFLQCNIKATHSFSLPPVALGCNTLDPTIAPPVQFSGFACNILPNLNIYIGQDLHGIRKASIRSKVNVFRQPIMLPYIRLGFYFLTNVHNHCSNFSNKVTLSSS